MLEFISLFGCLASSIIGGQDACVDQYAWELNRQEIQAEYKCQEPQWTTSPRIISGHFEGEIINECVFKGESGGGLRELEAYLGKKIVDEAKTVHSGPTAVEIEKMPGQHWDVTIDYRMGNDNAVVRQDTWVVTDEATRLASIARSKSIQGTGNAAYIKTINFRSDVMPAKEAGWWKITVVADTKIAKPWFIPGSVFLSEAKKMLQEYAPTVQKEIIEDIAPHI